LFDNKVLCFSKSKSNPIILRIEVVFFERKLLFFLSRFYELQETLAGAGLQPVPL